MAACVNILYKYYSQLRSVTVSSVQCFNKTNSKINKKLINSRHTAPYNPYTLSTTSLVVWFHTHIAWMFVADFFVAHKKSGSQTHTYFSSNQKARDSLFAILFCMCSGLFSEPVSEAISRRDVAMPTPCIV